MIWNPIKRAKLAILKGVLADIEQSGSSSPLCFMISHHETSLFSHRAATKLRNELREILVGCHVAEGLFTNPPACDLSSETVRNQANAWRLGWVTGKIKKLEGKP